MCPPSHAVPTARPAPIAATPSAANPAALASQQPRHGYDRVLVDAECTHDGSIKHLAKFAQWGWESFEARFLEPSRLDSLATLQRGLLRVGHSWQTFASE